MSDSRGRYLVGVDVGGTQGSSVDGEAFVWLLESSGELPIWEARASDTRIAPANTGEGD